MRRFAQLAAWAGLLTLEVAIAVAYHSYGTWWHWLLHQLIGWGVGLSAAALVAAMTRYRVPAVLALTAGQLASIVPDLAFRYLRMPHEPGMDLFLGHISIHTGPTPVLVALASLLLGGWGWIAMTYARPRLAVPLALAGLALVGGACLLAADVPTRLADYPVASAR